MASLIVLVVIGLVETAVAIFLIRGRITKMQFSGSGGKEVETLQAELASREAVLDKVSSTLEGMVEVNSLKKKVVELLSLQESLRAERGRITITQAELETVESRLRELEEIERELEASGIETKEEIKILEKKGQELKQKNDQLKQQIELSLLQLDKLLQEVEMSAQMQEQIGQMRADLVQTESKITNLLLQIEEGNDQYFTMKRRYDALDIEYAQLYEKFAETEAMSKG